MSAPSEEELPTPAVRNRRWIPRLVWMVPIAAAVIGGASLFGGRGKISDLMGDVAKGIRSFRKGLNEPDEDRAILDRRDEPVKKDSTTGQ